jgi:exodeoxyribonuclease VII large subunit
MAALPDRSALRAQLQNGWARLAAAARDEHTNRAERLGRARDKLRVLAPSARLRAQHDRMRAALRALLRAASTSAGLRRTRYARAAERLAAERPRTAASRLRLRAAAAVLARAAARATDGPRSRLATLAAQLDSLSPLAVLGRGYAVARRADDGRIIRTAVDVAAGDEISVRVARARVDASVQHVEEIDED